MAEAADFEQLESFIADFAARASPGERKKLARRVAQELRKARADSIGRNEDPEGNAFEPRRSLRSRRRGSVRRKPAKMFLRARTRQYLREQATDGEASVGFVGAMARIMTVHQEGQEDNVTRDPASPVVKYPMRRVIGFGPDDRLRILELCDTHLSG